MYQYFILLVYVLILFFQCINILDIFYCDSKKNPSIYDGRNITLCEPIFNFVPEILFELGLKINFSEKYE